MAVCSAAAMATVSGGLGSLVLQSSVGSSSSSCRGLLKSSNVGVVQLPGLMHRGSLSSRGRVAVGGGHGGASVRCEAAGENNNTGLSGLKEAVDRLTKKEVSEEVILRNQETNESEKRSVFGAVPKSGSFYPRPEIERRPETGDRSFTSLFAFDGAVPETINCRLAMLGIVWAFVAEKATGLTVMEQLFNPTTSGLVFFVGAIQLFTYASLIPIMNGESTDARSFGPFTAVAERWNGRLAMLGFFSLIVTEMFRGTPVFH